MEREDWRDEMVRRRYSHHERPGRRSLWFGCSAVSGRDILQLRQVLVVSCHLEDVRWRVGGRQGELLDERTCLTMLVRE